jgi:hypothetical protein
MPGAGPLQLIAGRDYAGEAPLGLQALGNGPAARGPLFLSPQGAALNKLPPGFDWW